MHGNIEQISQDYACSLGAAAQLACHIQALEAEVAYARNFINDHCIARVPKGSQELLAKGGKGFYRWQFYLREALFNPRILRLVVNDLFAKHGDLVRSGSVQLAGVESAAVPLLTALALEAERCGCPVNVFAIRKEAKAYGKRNWLEGAPSEKPALLVDDLVSPNHYTVLHAMRIMRQHGIEPASHIYAPIYKTHSPLDAIECCDKTFSISHMFSLNDFDLFEAPKDQGHGTPQQR